MLRFFRLEASDVFPRAREDLPALASTLGRCRALTDVRDPDDREALSDDAVAVRVRWRADVREVAVAVRWRAFARAAVREAA